MTHDIIDNRKQKLVDHINRILSSTEAARFAVKQTSCPEIGRCYTAVEHWRVR
jgi:hypothetical protein